MIKKVKKAVQKYGMLDMGDRVIVAVSGGKDSMSLLKVLDMISGEYRLTLIVAHLNHGIRGDDADREEAFVRQFSHNMGIEFQSTKIHVPSLKKGAGKSIEDVGREERYRFLSFTAQKYGAQKIALGHHLHDQAETVIMNLLRGSGADGLKGMLPVRDSMFIRPLLFVGQEEIAAFIEEHQIPYVTDSSNDSNIYLRNRIRHSLMPTLKKEFNPRLEENLSVMAEIFRLENDYMKTVTIDLFENVCLHLSGEQIKIKRADLRNQHPAIQNRMIKNLLEKFSTSGKGIGYVHVTAVIDLADSDMPGGRLNLPSGIHVWCEYDWLCFSRQDKNSTGFNPACLNEKTKNLFYNVSIPDAVNIQELGLTMTFDLIQQPQEVASGHSNIVYMDYEKIIPPLVVRTIRPGDRIQPLGMEGTMKLKSYFIDRKMPKRQRGETILLVDGKSVVWIAGMRLSERVKITNKSRKFLKVEIV
jgi:tRNA(Ile)-lysidine synthase